MPDRHLVAASSEREGASIEGMRLIRLIWETVSDELVVSRKRYVCVPMRVVTVYGPSQRCMRDSQSPGLRIG
mgnify:CR=1 FL=1